MRVRVRVRVKECEEKNTSEKQFSIQEDKYGPSMRTKTTKVFSGPETLAVNILKQIIALALIQDQCQSQI